MNAERNIGKDLNKKRGESKFVDFIDLLLQCEVSVVDNGIFTLITRTGRKQKSSRDVKINNSENGGKMCAAAQENRFCKK